MPNPPLLLCDSDALTQFFLADEIRPLKHLKESYGIQPTIVQEVDIELRWLGRYRDRFVMQLDKTIKSGVLRVLDSVYFQSFLGHAPVGASWTGFQSLGAQYYGYVGRGEAFTFAAGVDLGMPALSNDFSAIKTLEGNFLALPIPVLRSFDLVAFCYENGFLELRACEAVRANLRNEREGLPKPFMHASFEDGLKTFAPRLRDGMPVIHASAEIYSDPLFVSKIEF
ncbi:MAG TPA: hypothetical protein VGL74_13560 [Terriglobales bacterium]|jgi:hypothetical protein